MTQLVALSCHGNSNQLEHVCPYVGACDVVLRMEGIVTAIRAGGKKNHRVLMDDVAALSGRCCILLFRRESANEVAIVCQILWPFL